MIMTHDTSNNGSNSVCGTKTCLPKSANPSFTNDNKNKDIFIYYILYMYMYAQWSSNDIKSPMGFPLIFPSSHWWPIDTTTEKRQLQLRHVRLVRHHLGQAFQLVLARLRRWAAAGGWPPKKIGTCGIWVLSLWKYYIGYIGWWWIIWWI